jgi:cobalt/nickel transport protein
MKQRQNLLLIIGVVVLMAVPLWLVEKPVPGPDGREVEIFKGADDQAKDVIGKIAPGYQPWFRPLMEPPSGEVGSLLFALQAALGAGFIGYWLGTVRTRARYEHAAKKAAGC